MSSDPIGTSDPICLPVNLSVQVPEFGCVGEDIELNFQDSPFWHPYSRDNQIEVITPIAPSGTIISGSFPNLTLNSSIAGSFDLTFTFNWYNPQTNQLSYTYQRVVPITVLSDEQCEQQEACLGSFTPSPGEYVLSAWVKEEKTAPSYENAGITIQFISFGNTVVEELGPFMAQGNVIDGWQKIQQNISVPSNADKIKIILNNSSNTDEAFFDDIRMQPADAAMKAFVYDPVMGIMRAELDDNNYAKFYDYDDEGKLIRIRQETERGVMTIQETNYNTSNVDE